MNVYYFVGVLEGRCGRDESLCERTPFQLLFGLPTFFFIELFFHYFSDGRDCGTGKLSFHELGIAKLSGFREWFSIHPIISESDGLMDLDLKTGSQKMIIFAHHHKVLDGLQVRFSLIFSRKILLLKSCLFFIRTFCSFEVFGYKYLKLDNVC